MALYNRENTLRMIGFYQRILLTTTDRYPIIQRINQLQQDLKDLTP